MTGLRDLPVAVIGAGPVGLAAAAHLVERGIRPLVFEKGRSVGAAVAAWSHVRVFTPWSLNVDAAAARLLAATGWPAPDPDETPTGAAIVRRYLEPLARVEAIAAGLHLGATVMGVTRKGFDKMTSPGRDAAPFVLHWRDAAGRTHCTEARSIIDASGVWSSPNPMGVDGMPVPGEQDATVAAAIASGIPDVLEAERGHYAGRRVLVVGAGHSAINVVLDLLRLQAEAPETRVVWALRRERLDLIAGGGLDDKLAERGALGLAAKAAIEARRLELLAPFAAEWIQARPDGVRIEARHGERSVTLDVDRIVVATGFRPDLRLLAELRVALDPAVEAPPALAPLIDPNLHSCGTVPPHGAAELAQPEPGLYIVGAKSYGRAPTFLMATGYEQVRSVVAAIAGDEKAARELHLVLPETGVCSAVPGIADAACCGDPVPAAEGADCRADRDAKAAAMDGCGCSAAPTPAPAVSGCCGGAKTRPDADLVEA
ncbi:FAD-dependent oxidoreductase [Prosthecodimorpha staleyi]|uniref:FAD-dependent oxidoreductase n=1 Tax=Prosthecodimorpha staleyi TaxID=2840188 RepID=A0A947GFA5_9HYPH|nr:FAD-dependent oxidoreductase [Prosthecodimorpha staleyi]MBT9292506.1 FAD-dependent oxidoreductase [Prosthecodimorpha staleyi]